MSFALGTATGKIELEYDGSGVAKAQQDIDGLGKRSKDTDAALNKTANVSGAAGLAIAAGFGLAVNSAAEFEKRIDAVAAVSGATEGQLQKISDKALQLGRDTAFSAGESALAMEELVKAGLSVDDVLNGAADATVALAAAGEVDLPTAATIASNAMNQFNLSAKDMVGVADSIAGAANASAIDVNDFGQSLSQVGAVANLAGVNFEDTATAIAILGNAGIKGSDAGTALKTMFSRLQPATAKQYNEMERLGLISFDANTALDVLAKNGMKNVAKGDAEKAMRRLSAELAGAEVGSAKAEKKFVELGLQSGSLSNAFYDAKGNTKSLAQVSGELAKATEGMNARQKQATLQTLFGSDAIRAAAILTDRGAKGFENMGKAMGKVSAAEVAAKRMDNFKGSLEEMMGSLETLGITVGTLLLPPLRALVDALTKALNWFLNLSDGQQKFIVAAIGTLGALLLIVAGVIKVILIVGKVQAALVALRGTMIATWAAALGPIALIIAAVIAVGIAIMILWKKSETFRTIVLGVWEAIKTAALAVAQWFMSTLVPFFSNAFSAIVAVVRTVFGAVVGVIRMSINLVLTVIRAGLNILRAIWKTTWGLFGPLVKAVFGLILSILRLFWTVVKGLFLLGVGVIKAAVTAGFNAMRTAVAVAMGAIRAVINAIWGAIGPYVKGVVNTIKGVVESAWNFIRDITGNVFGALRGIIDDKIDAALDVVRGIGDVIENIFSGAGSWLLDAGRDIVQGLIDGVVQMIDNFRDKIDDLTDIAGKFLPGSPVREGALRVLNNGYAGKQIVRMILDGIESEKQTLQRMLADTVDVVPVGRPVDSATAGRVRAPRGGNGTRAVRMTGSLKLVGGRAYIEGIATDVNDDDDDYDDTLGRMN